MIDADDIAREAARLFDTGRVPRLEDAIEAALLSIGAEDAPRPGVGRVRRHLQAMVMQRLGDDGYRAAIVERLTLIEELMTAFVEVVGSVRPFLMGRAARGHFDGTSRVYLRLHTDLSAAELAAHLEQLGYADVGIETVNTSHGRLNRLTIEDDGLDLVLTRCPGSVVDTLGVDLFTGKPVAQATVDDVRALIAGFES